jgi:rRNA maturation endonuclease Nob1
MFDNLEIRAYQALVREVDNEIKEVETRYDREFSRVCMLVHVIAQTVPNPRSVIQEVQDRLEKDGDTNNNLVQFYRENYELV